MFFIGIFWAFLMEFIENLKKKEDEELKIFFEEISKIKKEIQKIWINFKKILNFEK